MLYKTFIVVPLFAVLLLCPFYSCKKHVNKPANPVEQLPAATQQGANTFGCLINGEVMVIHKPFGDLSPDYNCFYQLIYHTPNGFSFNVNGTDKQDGCLFKSVGIELDSLRLTENTYFLNTPYFRYGRSGSVGISKDCSSSLLMYVTNETTKGEITITHFDPVNHIVSGTFWFDAVELTNGDTVHVTEGRFDMQYTQ